MTLCTFVWAGAAEEVLVVGHFPTRNPIRLLLADGVFTAAVELAPGEYCYKVRGGGQGQACVTLLP
jgi:1,4-alpha-glucan branching enzyme